MTLADKFRRMYATTKEEIVQDVKETFEKIIENSKTDNIHTAAYYHVYEKLVKEFLEKLERTILFERLEDFWKYEYSISYTGMNLLLQHCDYYGTDDDTGMLYFNEDQTFVLFEVSSKMLTVEEYAEIYGIEVGTVRQWIRRGKIRTAVKSGKEWRIPELTDFPKRGYVSAHYRWKDELIDLPDEYKYLNNYRSASIRQDEDDKSLYYVVFHKEGEFEPDKILECDTKDREKIELYFISNPQIEYCQQFTEGLVLDLMHIYSKDEEVQ